MTSSQSQINTTNIDLARNDKVIEALADFAGKPVCHWLPSSHRAPTTEFLTADGKPFRSYRQFKQRFGPEEIVQVLAATGPSHCIDGWTYFSRALSALLAGDMHTARHLSYYSQLRAALSLLHCHGIGIFNGINFTVDQCGALHRIDKISDNKQGLGTHKAVWKVLECWANSNSVSSVFLNSIEFRGVSLSDCIDALWPSRLTTPLMSKVISAWGVDLKRSAQDLESRNVSSYSAHAFNPAVSDLSTRLEFVRQIWLGLEPDGRGGFPNLDRHLLRKFLRLMDHQFNGTLPSTKWDLAYARLHPQIRDFVSQDFVQSSEGPTDLVVLKYADDQATGDVHAMISRALLLLRTATLIVRKAFLDAGFHPLADKLQFWLENVGIDRGFWPPDSQPEQVEDLWDTVSSAVADLPDGDSATTKDQFSFLEEFNPQIILLSQAERAFMWGVCS